MNWWASWNGVPWLADRLCFLIGTTGFHDRPFMYGSIETAINCAKTGDTVQILAGTYGLW